MGGIPRHNVCSTHARTAPCPVVTKRTCGRVCHVLCKYITTKQITHSLGQVTRALRGVEDLVVENGEVEG